MSQAQEVAVIDVERLTVALWGMKWDVDARRMAAKIAAEYARLIPSKKVLVWRNRLWSISAILGGAALFGLTLEVLPTPIGHGLAFASALTAGRFAEHLWPTIGTGGEPR